MMVLIMRLMFMPFFDKGFGNYGVLVELNDKIFPGNRVNRVKFLRKFITYFCCVSEIRR